MSTNYPSSLDTLTNPVGTNTLDSPDHAGQHANSNDAIEAIEAKIGVGAGTPTVNKALVGSGNGTSLWADTWNNAILGTPAITGGTITSPVINVASDATGDTYYRSAAGAFTRLGIGAADTFLKSNGTLPSWSAVTNVVKQLVASGTLSGTSTTSVNTEVFWGEGTITPTSSTSTIYIIGAFNGISQEGTANGRFETRVLYSTSSGGTTGTQIANVGVAADSVDTNGVMSCNIITSFAPGTTTTQYVKVIAFKGDALSGTAHWGRYSYPSRIIMVEV